MTTVDPMINDTMTQVQLRQIRQRLNEERLLRTHGSPSPRAAPSPDENVMKLQQSLLKRQELMDRIRQEKSLGADLSSRRPASYATHRRTPMIPDVPARAESQPPPDPYIKRATTPRQVLTHEFRPIRLSPMDNPPPPPPQPIIHTTALPPSYVVPGNYGQNPPTNTKTEMMEMMMLQSAQMHQMVMNQMMMQSIPKNTPESGRRSSRVIEDDDVYLSRRPQRVYVDRQVYPQLPPMGYPPQPAQYTPRYYPAELEPLQQPRDHEPYLLQQYQRHHSNRPDTSNTQQ